MDKKEIFTAALPRLDLHCHLDGSLTLSCIRELLGRPVSPEEIHAAPDCQSLAEYLQKFRIPLECLQTEKGLKAAGLDLMRQAYGDGLSYIEARFAPLFSCENGMSVKSVIEAVLSGMEEGRAEYGIDYGVIVCAMRHESGEKNLAMLKSAREFLGNGVCAADLAGDESAFPMSQFLDLFKEAKSMGFPFTLHAGECGSVTNIMDAVDCGASRIGHGIAMRGNKAAIRHCYEKHVGIEMCPVSNIQTKAVPSADCYPLQEFLSEKLLVSLNTDNRTVSGTSIEKEFEFARTYCGLTKGQEAALTRNAVETAFAPDDVKHRLLNASGGCTAAYLP